MRPRSASIRPIAKALIAVSTVCEPFTRPDIGQGLQLHDSGGQQALRFGLVEVVHPGLEHCTGECLLPQLGNRAASVTSSACTRPLPATCHHASSCGSGADHWIASNALIVGHRRLFRFGISGGIEVLFVN